MMKKTLTKALRNRLGIDVRRCRNTCFTSLTAKSRVVDLLRELHPVAPRNPLIRLGPTGDGGYLVPDCLDGIQACFSPGVCDVSGFEKDCADRGMKVFMADASVEHAAEEHELFTFSKKYIGAFCDSTFMSMDSWVNQSLTSSESDLMLQMDIEGFEYESIFSVSEGLMRRFRIIALELHWLDQFWNKPFFELASRAIRKLLHTHVCVHIHPNNESDFEERFDLLLPLAMEFTFVRRELATREHRSDFPHRLDFDNTNRPSQVLPRCWYMQ